MLIIMLKIDHLKISQNYNERKALDSIMERYFMLGNKDHQFFDITAAAYVRNFILNQ